MKCTIETTVDNKLLKRKEITGKLIFAAATPSNADVIKEVTSQLKTKEENVLIRSIKTAFGESTATFSAYVYESPEALKTYTPITKHIKDQAKKAVEDAAKAKEEATKAKEEATKAAEAPKEEPKAEEKPAEAPAEKPDEAKAE